MKYLTDTYQISPAYRSNISWIQNKYLQDTDQMSKDTDKISQDIDQIYPGHRTNISMTPNKYLQDTLQISPGNK